MPNTLPGDSQLPFAARMQCVEHLCETSQLDEAEREIRSLLEIAPSDEKLLRLLAAIVSNRGDFAEAIKGLTHATNASGASAQAWIDLGCILAAVGRLREAQATFDRAVKIAPTLVSAVANLGLAYQELGDLELADRWLREALRLDPKYVPALCSFGHQFRKTGNPDLAIPCFEEALRHDPLNADAANGLGMAFYELGDVEKAIHYFHEAFRVNPRFANASNNLATALKDLGQLDDAVSQYQATLALSPHHPQTIYSLSQLAAEGRYEFDAQKIEDVKSVVAAGAGAELERSSLCFAIGTIHDAAGEYDAAFEYFRQAHDLRRKSHPFDAPKHRELVERIVKTFDEDYFRAVQGWRPVNQTPIFIVGMPRSGSTLVEQILATDPNVFAAGEHGGILRMMERFTQSTGTGELCGAKLPIPNAQVANEFADRFLADLAKISRDSPRVTIKTLENFLHLGAIATLFPGVRIVHCIRDPLDTCVSCYFQNFAGLHFSWDFDDIADYYHAYQRLAAHWKQTLQVRMHEVRYEDLVHNPEKVTRDLLAYCDLEWTPQCFRYFENKSSVRSASTVQVRQPLTAKHIGRWKHYRDHLGPLIAALSQSLPGLIFEESTLTEANPVR